jgi:hypothetical protein
VGSSLWLGGGSHPAVQHPPLHGVAPFQLLSCDGSGVPAIASSAAASVASVRVWPEQPRGGIAASSPTSRTTSRATAAAESADGRCHHHHHDDEGDQRKRPPPGGSDGCCIGGSGSSAASVAASGAVAGEAVRGVLYVRCPLISGDDVQAPCFCNCRHRHRHPRERCRRC